MSMAIEILANNMRLRNLGGWQNHCTDNLGIGDHLYIVLLQGLRTALLQMWHEDLPGSEEGF